jgi:outer membrane protein assembly factor BamD
MKKITVLLLFAFSALLLFGCRSDDFLYDAPIADLYRIGMEKMESGKEDEAREIFEVLQSRAPSIADEALYRSGETYFRQKFYDDAYYKFDRLLDRYPASPWCDDAQYMKGLCRLKASSDIDKDSSYDEDALDEFLTLLEEYEGSDLTDEAWASIAEARSRIATRDIVIAKYYAKTGEYEAAIVYLDIVLSLYSDLPIAGDALYQKGYCYEKLKDDEGAIGAYETIISEYPDTPSANKAAERLKKLGNA